MKLLALALTSFVLGGLGALLSSRRARFACGFGAGAAVIGSALGLAPALSVLATGRSLAAELPWSLPGGALSLSIDPLSAFFLVPIFVVGAATASYGAGYLLPEARHRLLGPAWLWFDLLLASMTVVATARNGLLFLLAWETMAIASFLLIVFHHERPEVVRAGWVYLVATHLGAACLLALFAWLASGAGSLDFAHWKSQPSGGSGLFLLAVIGFGSKAGLVPLHVWLPEAHPVAPSHVSALLSGVMVKLGVYGLLRILWVLGAPEAAWGGLLLGAGLLTATYGALALLTQRDLKRLLAYSTIENVGVIALGLGLGLLAAARGATPVAALLLAGGLFHVWNHALFKSLLFLSAGSVATGAGTLDLERLGGLLRRMPWTGAAFLAGGAAVCALPPFNGFLSELLIYLGCFRALGEGSLGLAPALAGIACLGFVGALAAAGFVRALGISLLGEPRSAGASVASEVGPWMRGVCAGLGAGCLLLGLTAPLAAFATQHTLPELLGADVSGPLRALVPALGQVSALAGVFTALALALLWLRRHTLAAPAARSVVTWDCGYAAPTSRMQYSASSFTQPLSRLFASALWLRTSEPGPGGPFPGRGAAFASHSFDFAHRAYERIFSGIAALALRVRPLEAGSTQLYVLYTVLAALGLLLWELA